MEGKKKKKRNRYAKKGFVARSARPFHASIWHRRCSFTLVEMLLTHSFLFGYFLALIMFSSALLTYTL